MNRFLSSISFFALALPLALATPAIAERTQHQLPEGYFVPAKFPPVAIHPRPDAETPAEAYHRVAYPGMRWDCPVRAAFGAYPYFAEIVTAPAGMTIGAWLVEKPDGELSEDAAYCTLTWPQPVVGTYPIAVRITDQQGAAVDFTWTLVVDTQHHYFVAPVATGKGDGSSRADQAAFATVFGPTSQEVSPAKGHVLVLASGTYPISEPMKLLPDRKPVSIMAYPGDTPELLATDRLARISHKSSDSMLSGLRFRNFGNAGCIFTYDGGDRLSVWRNTFTGFFGDTKISDNESVWFCGRLDRGKRRYLLMAENTYVDCIDVCVFDFYTVGPMLSERDVFITSQPKVSEPLWFPKSMCDYDIRRHVFDNPGSLAPWSGVMAGYNAKHEGGTSSGEVRYNFVRSAIGEGALSRWNGASTADTQACFDYRNTYIGGGVAAVDYLRSNQVLFEANVIQNQAGGIAKKSDGFTEKDTECHGQADIVDPAGKLVGPYKDRFRGRRGSQIVGAKP